MRERRLADVEAVREQLGREPTTEFVVVARCATDGGHPLVIRNHPLDQDGRPFPTLYWLTCPVAVKAVARLESEGWIAKLSERARSDPGFFHALNGAHAAYALDRASAVRDSGPWGGVGGARRGIKCLHAHYAHHLAGGADPVGTWVAERVEPVHDERPGRVAAVDTGTNSIRFLVAEPAESGELIELARDLVLTRLGQGVDRSGLIAPDALDRTIGVLERFCRRARALHAARIRVAATSAVRDASNRNELERAIRELAGSELEVITGEREAALSFLGATHDLDAPAPFLVLDIGGGSTEFVVGEDGPEASISTQMGSVRLTERFVRHDPPTADELAAIARAVDDLLETVEGAIPVGKANTMVAVAGTATTVQAVALDLPAYDPDRIHRTSLSAADAQATLERLAAMTVAQRAALPVMTPGREDVIVAGATILARVLARWQFDEALISERDILDGLAIDMVGPG
jgi:exopolyphosphatase/guanosine-5'-triphosphate,3'-diphosphate pyrophosphatase